MRICVTLHCCNGVCVFNYIKPVNKMLLETIHFKNYEISDPQTTDALKIRHTFYRQCPPVVTYLDK